MLEQKAASGISTETPESKRIPLVIDIKDISNAKYIGKYVEITGTLTEKERTSFVARTMVEMTCKSDPDNKNCKECRHLGEGKTQYDIKLDVFNSEILSYVNAKERELRTMYKHLAKIPADCRKCNFSKLTTNKNLYRCGIVPCIDYVSSEKKSVGETVDNMYSIHVAATLFGEFEAFENRDYRFLGVPHIDPTDGRLIFLIDHIVPIADDISDFEMTPVRKKLLSRFQSELTAEAVRAKNAEILKEKRVNHHRVFGYGRMEYFMHMTFHSVSAFMFNKSPHYRGWLDGAIVGDSRTGKSEMLEQTINLHQMGYRAACDNISQAGITGGMSQSSIKGGQYQLKWGLLPRLDRRLIGFDEAHSPNAIGLWPKLNDARSSGLVKISKVGVPDRTTKARVRKLFIANPPNGETTRSFYNPVEMIRNLFTTPESIARLDFLYIPRIEDSTDGPNEDKERITPSYCGKVDKLLIKWIYSRTVDQVIFTEEAERYIESQAAKLAEICDSIHIPLIQGNEARFTLSRGAAAQAASQFSTNASYEQVVVHKCHAQVWIETLISNYKHESTNYFAYSFNINKKIKFENSEEFFDVCTNMRDLFKGTDGMVRFLLEEGAFNFRYLRDMVNVNDHSLNKINSAMIRYNLINAKATNASFTKTRRGIAVFKYLLKAGTGSLIEEKDCKKWFDSLSGV